MSEELVINGGPDRLALAVAAVGYQDESRIQFSIEPVDASGINRFEFRVLSLRKEGDGYHMEGRGITITDAIRNIGTGKELRRVKVRYETHTNTGTICYLD